MSVAKRCLAFSGLFEAEVLVELMLRYWNHPLAPDEEFRNNLLEGAASVLRACAAGQKVIEEIPGRQMNFIAAVWYSEWTTLASGIQDAPEQRHEWLEKLRKALPSCFCAPDRLS
jgi:hypothetical protein